MLDLLFLAAAVLAMILVGLSQGKAAASLLLVFVTVAAFARRILVFVDVPVLGHIGIADASVGLQSYQLALLIAWLCLPLFRVVSNIPISYRILVPLLALAAVMQADTAPMVVSGLLHVMFACLAWGVGATFVESIRSRKISESYFVNILLVPIFIQGFMCALQLMGIRDVGAVETGGSLLVRINGLTGHPGTLGKLLMLLLVPLLPLTQSTIRRVRTKAWLGVALICVLIGLTFSRANVVAVLVAVLIWIVLAPGVSVLRRFTMPALIAICAIPVLDVLVLRSEYDPDGGRRPELIAPALEQLSRTFWFGIGPNDYVRTVGQFDALTATGYSVHNTFLLAAVELGMIGAVLLAIPVVVTILIAIRLWVRGGNRSAQAIALLAVVPGLIVMAASGWGLLQEEVFVLLMLVLGYARRKMQFDSGSPLGASADSQLTQNAVRYVR